MNFIKSALDTLVSTKSATVGSNVTLSNEFIDAMLDKNKNTAVFNHSRQVGLGANTGSIMTVVSPVGGLKTLKATRLKNGTVNPNIKSDYTITDIKLQLSSYVSSIDIPVDVKNTIRNQANAEQLLQEYIYNDIMADKEYIGLFSDTTSVVEDLNKFDGIVKIANKVYGQDGTATVADYDNTNAHSTFDKLLSTYDVAFKNANNMVYYVSDATLRKYRKERIDKGITELHESIDGLQYEGINIVYAPVLDGTDVDAILTHIDNIYFAINDEYVALQYRETVLNDTIDTVVFMTAGLERKGATVVATNVAKPE